ncbi:MAG: nitrite/sulfite reductase, partial [Cellvibrionaceae bacterium]|nr:nitrite/sulfite reductase [Cellvibrionaceae bacterium]
MYQYDHYDQAILSQRVAQFKSQTERYLAGELSEEAYLPLRLQNGLYVQRLAPMLRVNVPYGMINAKQLRTVARLARDYDKGYVHITTRQNIQFNWPELSQVPELLAELAAVEMHATQSSGNCIRNTTTDQFAGVAVDELLDPRPYCEIIRQWSTLHPEFAFLPRKFKIAVSAADEDRAATALHDIGLKLVKNDAGEAGFTVLVGGGLGRTPIIGSVVREFLPEQELLSYLDAILRVYNLKGRRDNKYKARIKILVKALGVEAFAELVEAEWARIKDGYTRLTEEEIARAKSFFTEPAYQVFDPLACTEQLQQQRRDNREFDHWLTRNVNAHKKPGYASVTFSLKPTGVAPGDVTDKQLETIAELAERYSFGEARTTHEQNIVLADVAQNQLFELWQALS